MTTPDPSVAAFDAALWESLSVFTKQTFATLNPTETLSWGWHNEAIVHALSEVEAGRVKRLVINVPPRSLKSITASVAFPAWMLARDPGKKIIGVSYAEKLAATFARQTRTVVGSDWFRNAFPGLRWDRDTELELQTHLGGYRIATSITGTLTGRGGDVMIIDDPINALDAVSAAQLETVREWYGGTGLTRLNRASESAIVLIMQRLHVDDLTGVVLAEDGWEHLNLPAIADGDYDVPVGRGRVHHWRKGELLDPVMHPQSSLDEKRRHMGEHRFAAQYLQAPAPLTGNLFKRAWFKTGDPPPDTDGYGYVVQSWDLAFSGGANADYCVCVTAFVRGGRIWILDVMRERLEFGEQLRAYEALAQRYRPREILVERAANAPAMLDQVRALEKPDVPSPLLITPKGDKTSRAIAATPVVERGDVLLPASAPWKDAFIDELCAFPSVSNDDQVDAFSQLVKRVFDSEVHFDAPGLIFAEVL